MGKHLKYPQIERLIVGQSFMLPAEGLNLPALRAAVSEYARRKHIRLTVHKNGDEIEIARRAQDADEALLGYITLTLHNRGLGVELASDIKELVDAALDAL